MSQNYDDIWFTYKTRIATEIRLINNNTQSQILLIWYALSMSIIAVIGLRIPDFLGQHTDLYSAIIAIVLLAISMLIAVRDYQGRAAKVRRNHIELKLLYDNLKIGTVSYKDKPSLYSKLLMDCENHSSYDYRYFLFLTPTSNSLKCKDYFALFTHFSLRWIFIVGLYAFPVFLIFWGFFKDYF